MNMGDYVFKLPDIGEGVVEGEIVTWHVKVGDSVAEDDSIVDVMTDKATVTIPSPTNGVVKELSGDVGDMIAVGTALITFSNDGVVNDPVDEEEKGSCCHFGTRDKRRNYKISTGKNRSTRKSRGKNTYSS